MPYSGTVPTTILIRGDNVYEAENHEELKNLAELLVDSFAAYGIKIRVDNIKPTPSINRFEISIARGTRISEVVSLKRDIQMLMKLTSIGIEAPIPGTSHIAIDIPKSRIIIPRLRNLLDNEDFIRASETTIALGSNTNNVPLLFDLARHQHLLITGSYIRDIEEARNSIVVSMLCKARYQNVKMLMIDPVDRSAHLFDGIRHLLMPVASSYQDISNTINYAINELDHRIKIMGYNSVRSIDRVYSKDHSYPHIVIFINAIDELLHFDPNDTYFKLCKLINQGVPAGIHLIISTNTNLRSKAFLMLNDRIRNKVVFRIKSSEQSQRVIYHDGAESLMDNGDMYYYDRPTNLCIRSNSPLVTPIEINDATKWLKENH